MKALLVKDGAIERIDLEGRGNSGASHIRELIGDGFGSCLSVPGRSRSRKIVGWCDDGFLMKSPAERPPWNVFLDDQSLYRGGYAIAGPIVIVGHNGPDSVDMTEVEMSAFRIARDRVWIGRVQDEPMPVRLPVLIFTTTMRSFSRSRRSRPQS